MEVIKQYYIRYIDQLIEYSDKQEWLEVADFLLFLKENPNIFLIVSIIIGVFVFIGIRPLIGRLIMTLIIKFSPDEITLFEQTKNYFEDSEERNYYCYQLINKSFLEAGFSVGKHYYKNQRLSNNLATYYKNGICGTICSENGGIWFELVVFFQDGSGVTVSSHGSIDLSSPPPKHKFISIKCIEDVQGAYDLILSEIQGKRIAPISDDNFIEIYEQFYARFIKFLKKK